jgi:hypothetical protein
MEHAVSKVSSRDREHLVLGKSKLSHRIERFFLLLMMRGVVVDAIRTSRIDRLLLHQRLMRAEKRMTQKASESFRHGEMTKNVVSYLQHAY